ncbi:MAG: DUF937 domain-containing protein [Thiobacillus sp.]|nr:DUF937 domain-containing protein [Thiobacillus sp.]
MGLFDDALGGVLGSLGSASDTPAGGSNAMLQLVTGLIKQHGGVGGLVDTLAKSGLGSQAASWVGSGDNAPVTGDQLGQALGGGQLAALAGQFGVDAHAINGLLAQYLPEVVNQLTPGGKLPDEANLNTLLDNALPALAGKLFR